MKRESTRLEHDRITSFDDKKVEYFKNSHFTRYIPSNIYIRFKRQIHPLSVDADVRLDWMGLFDAIVLGLIVLVLYGDYLIALYLLILRSILEFWATWTNVLSINQDTSILEVISKQFVFHTNYNFQLLFSIIDIVIGIALSYHLRQKLKSIHRQRKFRGNFSSIIQNGDGVTERKVGSNQNRVLYYGERQLRPSSLNNKSLKRRDLSSEMDSYYDNNSRALVKSRLFSSKSNLSSNKRPSGSQNKNSYHFPINEVYIEQNDQYNSPKKFNQNLTDKSNRSILLKKNEHQGNNVVK